MVRKNQPSKCEIWGGIECSINRVGNNYFDQLAWTGHYHRPDDITRLASLGFRVMRYPVLWERHQSTSRCPIDWTWTAARLADLKDHGVIPIAGLVHHGSGPAFTNVTLHTFAPALAAYAAEVARHFPWLEYYTPINEPLTTARFTGLYGLWHPHARDEETFCRILMNEVKATVLAMRAIRNVNPEAKLIQTEDLGKVYASPALQYQADFENQRRWLSYDLLCGKVDPAHSLWDYLLWARVPENDLRFLLDNPCVPYCMGFNYYVTSERYLDEQMHRYPAHLWGGNGKHSYADTEAIRINHNHPSGLKVLLKEAWDRYNIPLALTETFLSCTPDEQVRWLHHTWTSVNALRMEGADIRAVCFWALLGEKGWNTLMTRPDGEYEAGAFDVRAHIPEETLMATYIRSLVQGDLSGVQDILSQPGWWQRSDRFLHAEENCIVR